MPLPKQFFEGVAGGFKGLFLAVMGMTVRVISGVEEPGPDHPLARAHHLHDPAGAQAVDQDAVVILRIGETLAPGEALAGEAVGIDFVFHASRLSKKPAAP